MSNKITNISKKPFVRNVFLLATGTAAAQFIGLISSPIITRLYGPEAFGIMGVFMAFIQIILPIAALTYPIAIVLPKDNKNAYKLIRLSILISFFLAVIVFLSILFLKDNIVDILQINEIANFLYLVPIVVFFGGVMQILNQWLIRTKQFGINAKAVFLQSLIINSSKIGTGLIFPSASVLVVLSALGTVLNVIIMGFLVKKSDNNYLSDDSEKELSIKEIAVKYKDFPLFRAPEVLLNSISSRFPIIMLTIFFGPAAAGFYTLGNTVLQQPIKLIGESIGNVFYSRITEAAHNKENLTKLILKTTLILSGIGIIPFGIIIIFGPSLFSLVFGSEWNMAGQYAQWIGVFLFFEFINKPSVKSLPVLSAQLFHLFFTTTILITRLIALTTGYFIFSSDLIAIILFSISSAFLNLLLIILVLKRSKSFDKSFSL